MNIKHVLSAAGLSLVLTALPSAQCDPLQVNWSQSHYEPFTDIVLTIAGEPGALGVLLLDPNPGPTLIPGLGSLDIGFSGKLITAFLPPLPPSGSLTITCCIPCSSPIVGTPLYTQAVNLDPDTFEICASNSDVLDVSDTTGICAALGCSPGYWKTHLDDWAATGYQPTDEFDAAFGVTLFGPGVTLYDVISNPGSDVQIFGVHSVAALLNASHPNGNYYLSVTQVLSDVFDAVASGIYEPTKDAFDLYNNFGCSL